ELRDHHHHGVLPGFGANLFGEARERAAELADPAGEVALRSALGHMGVPAADVDEAEDETVAHPAPDAPCRQLEAPGGDGATVGRGHFHRLVDVVANLEAFRDRA